MLHKKMFGMGINKNNIRFVIHGDLPKSMEGYYQETGRAGRDGMDAVCILFFGSGDILRQRYFIDRIEDPREREKCIQNLDSLVRYATVRICRRKQILEYFGEAHGGNCGNCDVCRGPAESVDATVDARMVLSAIARAGESFGINHIIDILRGADTEKIRKNNHDALKTFGVGKHKSKEWWRRIISELIAQQKIHRDASRFNILRIRDSGRKVLFGEEPFFIHEELTDGRRDTGAGAGALRVGEAPDGKLLKKLKEVRSALARTGKIPPYIIFSDKTLLEMAAIMPESAEEFLSVPGVGEKKLETYGPHFLPVIRKHAEKG